MNSKLALDVIIPIIVEQVYNIWNTTEKFKAYDYQKYTDDGFMNWEETQKGILLKYSYGIPDSIVTPYGLLRLKGCCSSSGNVSKIIHEKMDSLFNLKLYEDIIENNMGCFGPYYEITTVNGLPLNESVERSTNLNKSNLIYEERKALYNTMFNK